MEDQAQNLASQTIEKAIEIGASCIVFRHIKSVNWSGKEFGVIDEKFEILVGEQKFEYDLNNELLDALIHTFTQEEKEDDGMWRRMDEFPRGEKAQILVTTVGLFKAQYTTALILDLNPGPMSLELPD